MTPKALGRRLWTEAREFSGIAGDATHLWPRWIVLRAIGAVFILVFAGIIGASQAIVGPSGIVPLGNFFAALERTHAGGLEMLCRAPTLFWLGSGQASIVIVEWLGMAAAIALVLNLWPRMALFACWLAFLSFVSTWSLFSGSIVDQLMLEVSLLCIPYAPGGLRPGLGADRPPRPIAFFMVRWMLFRVMFESGILKLATGDPYWRHFTVMKILYETAPFPTILAYIDHHLPQSYHVFEVGLTLAAEIPGPLLAVFWGRRGRWIALWLWVVFQAGIQLTNNFGWLNTAAIALGLVLLDDQMLTAAAERLGLRRLGAYFTRTAVRMPLRPSTPWRIQGLRIALSAHFLLTIYYFVTGWNDAVYGIPYAISGPIDYAWFFHSANVYYPFGRMTPERYEVEFEGTNDQGATWRTYEYRFQPQRPDRICPFIAPWYARFDATLQIAVFAVPKSPVFPTIATEILSRNKDVIGQFRRDPFPDRPPTAIRMLVYRISFTDYATLHRTGNYWNKEYEGDFLPPLYLDEHGNIAGGG